MKYLGNKLSAAAVRNARKPGLYGDGHGLYLQISEFKTKSWVFRYMRNGVARKAGLGALHTVSLSEARQRAAAWRLKVLDGVDPIDERREARGRRKVETARAVSFRQCAEKYIEAHRAGWRSEKHAQQWVASFAETKRSKTASPAPTAAINDLPVAAVDTGLVLKVLEPLWRRTPETAGRIRGRIELVLDWAKARGLRDGENPARWRGHLDKLLPSRTKVQRVVHLNALAYPDMPAFMAELRAKAGVAPAALEFLVLTAARAGEVVGATWSEIDTEARQWVISASRMKSGKEHRVPLCDRALAILEAIPRGDGGPVFPGGTRKGALSDRAMRDLIHAMRPGVTVHGFRSTFCDWTGNETNFPRELPEQALAHATGDAVERAYRRSDALERRRQLMSAWAQYCAQPPSARSGEVLAIRRGAK